MSRLPPPLAPEASDPDHSPGVATKTSGLAVTSLVLGILGFLTCGLTGLVGGILGVVALVGINNSRGHLRGQGVAVSGIVVSAVSLISALLFGALASIAIPQMAMAQEQARLDLAATRLNSLASAANFYAIAHDRLPPANDWPGALVLLDSSGAPDPGLTFAMNMYVDQMPLETLRDPTSTVLFFEADFGSPLAGGPELLPNTPRFFDGYLIAFADGTVATVPPSEIRFLIWRP